MKTFVLGVDGVPYSFLEENFKKGKMKNLAKIFKENGKKINSVYPTVSSVAWTTYATGENPGRHNIFGFVDRIPNPFRINIPTARERKTDTLWQRLSEQGKRVIVINVPLTYPPEKVNGILVAGFLSPGLDKVSYPSYFNNYLKDKGYVIDVDAWLARKSKREFMDALHKAMEKRFEITFELLKGEWDFFQVHIMETDRLFHFFWQDWENKGEYYPDTENFFEKLDGYIGRLEKELSTEGRFLILSDHGFCGIKKEVQLNSWLENLHFLKFAKGKKKLENYKKTSLCYSLLPGRIFVNLKGREEKGSVEKEDYERVREEIREALLSLKDSDSGEKVIEKVFFREEIYEGPYIENAADIIAHPVKGYDLKGKVDASNIFESSILNGMHTHDDAFICGRGYDLTSVSSIQDVYSLIRETY